MSAKRAKPEPDIELGARVRAKSVRFGCEPDVDVRFTGDCESETATERENLPDEVEAGVTYANVEVRWHAAARIHPQPREGSS